MSAPQHLVDRHPQLDLDRIVADLVPPPRFNNVRLNTYDPDPSQPSQMQAVEGLGKFLAAAQPAKRGIFRREQPATEPPGVYLDGGFGVGKTHLLASLWHAHPGPKAFGTFVELTNVCGALGFAETVTALSEHRLLCIDEFELDDPGDTVLVSSLLMALVGNGTRISATSNTLPGRLGEGRFAAVDFIREIQGLAAHFRVLRIEGEDYRHRGLPQAHKPSSDEELQNRAARVGKHGALDDFNALLEHLTTVHPARYGPLVDGLHLVQWTNVHAISDQAMALRLVVLIDRLYDREIAVAATGVPLDQLFTPELLAGGYKKKYMRALSRVVALSRDGSL